MPNNTKGWYKPTEALLYYYKSFPIRILSFKLRRSQLIIPGDQETIKKLDQQIEKLTALAQMIESSIDQQLDPVQQELVKRVYYERQPWQAVCNDLSISKSNFYREKNRIIEILAYLWGYIPANQHFYK